MTDTTDEGEGQPVEVTWAPILVTLLFSVIQGLALFYFFLSRRAKDMERTEYSLFEPRQFEKAHRSPPPFDGGKGILKWARAAYHVSEEDTLRAVGLDAYMFLRFLRLATRMTLLGTALSVILIPVYSTGEARGIETESFNSWTLARVDAGSNRLWASLICWWIFVAFILWELWKEWALYARNRYDYLAKGDVDTPPDYRYAVRVENVPSSQRSTGALRAYFERLFPNQVRQVSVCLFATKLDKLVAERQTKIEALEKAIAFTHAKPDKDAPTVKDGAKMGCCGGEKKEAIPFYKEEIVRLNKEIDTERQALLVLAAENDKELQRFDGSPEKKQVDEDENKEEPIEIDLSDGGSLRVDTGTFEDDDQEEEVNPTDGYPSSTGYITFTSLRAKQEAVQSEISGKKDRMDVFPASEPSGVLWENITVPLTKQRLVGMAVASFWIVGLLFWAVPVAFVTSIANLNGILQGLGLDTANPESFWYGLVAGLLPVIALAILMAVLYMAIVAAASKIIRKKSMPEVDTYTLAWHQLYQFANLWLILIGGSIFNQIDALIKDPSSIANIIASAMPGASVFFVNMIVVGSFGAFGLELSCLATYGVKLIMNLIQPEAQRTQRMLDDAHVPPTIIWGKIIPPMVFIYLVSVLYMAIVPIIEVFALVYFAGFFIIYKHQALHVYATEFEGGGTTTWQTLFGFLIAALYMSEIVFIAYMGVKEGAAQGGLGFVPLVATILVHVMLNRNIVKPLKNLSLEVAADVDIQDGELSRDAEEMSIEKQLYGQPCLKTSEEERGPLPYRRDENLEQDSEWKVSDADPEAGGDA